MTLQFKEDIQPYVDKKIKDWLLIPNLKVIWVKNGTINYEWGFIRRTLKTDDQIFTNILRFEVSIDYEHLHKNNVFIYNNIVDKATAYSTVEECANARLRELFGTDDIKLNPNAVGNQKDVIYESWAMLKSVLDILSNDEKKYALFIYRNIP